VQARLMSHEINYDRGADTVLQSGRQHPQWRQRELSRNPAGSKNLCMHGTFVRENRGEIPTSPIAQVGATGRSGNAGPQA